MLKGLSKSTRIAAVIPVSDFGTEPGSSAADRDLVLMSRSVSLLSVDKKTPQNPRPDCIWSPPQCVYYAYTQPESKPRSDNTRLQCSLIPCTFGCCRSKGLIKRVPLKQFASINRLGLAAMGVKVCQAGLWEKRCCMACMVWLKFLCAKLAVGGKFSSVCLLVMVRPLLLFVMRVCDALTGFHAHPIITCLYLLQEGDALQFVGLCSPTDSVLVAASNGQILHFAAKQLRQMGRTAAGVQVGRGAQP